MGKCLITKALTFFLMPIRQMPKSSSQTKDTIPTISVTRLLKVAALRLFHLDQTGKILNRLMAISMLCAIRLKDVSINSSALEGSQHGTIKQLQAISASFISYQHDYGSGVCQHDLDYINKFSTCSEGPQRAVNTNLFSQVCDKLS